MIVRLANATIIEPMARLGLHSIDGVGRCQASEERLETVQRRIFSFKGLRVERLRSSGGSRRNGSAEPSISINPREAERDAGFTATVSSNGK